MGITKVTKIQWDIEFEDFFDGLLEMTVKAQARILGIPNDKYINMTTEERNDYAYDVFRHSPSVADEVFDLPTEIELPDGEWTEELITEYLSNEYGFCLNGYSLPEIDMETN